MSITNAVGFLLDVALAIVCCIMNENVCQLCCRTCQLLKCLHRLSLVCCLWECFVYSLSPGADKEG